MNVSSPNPWGVSLAQQTNSPNHYKASNARVLAFGASAGVLYGVASAMRFMSDKNYRSGTSLSSSKRYIKCDF